MYTVILLMEEILHELIGSLYHYLQGFLHPRWCRMSPINSMNMKTTVSSLIVPFVSRQMESQVKIHLKYNDQVRQPYIMPQATCIIYIMCVCGGLKTHAFTFNIFIYIL